jgi:hypothetical protein
MYVLGVDVGKTCGLALVDTEPFVRDRWGQLHVTSHVKWYARYPWFTFQPEKHIKAFQEYIYGNTDGLIRSETILIIAEMPALNFGYRFQSVYLAAQAALQGMSDRYQIPLKYVTPGVWKNSWVKTIKLPRDWGIHARDAAHIAFWAVTQPDLIGATDKPADVIGDSIIVLNKPKDDVK